MRAFISFLMSYLCTIETKGQGFLGFMRVLGWFNKHQCTHTRPTNRALLPYAFTHISDTKGTGFFFSFWRYIVYLEFIHNQELSTPNNVIHYIHSMHGYGEFMLYCSARQLAHALMLCIAFCKLLTIYSIVARLNSGTFLACIYAMPILADSKAKGFDHVIHKLKRSAIA